MDQIIEKYLDSWLKMKIGRVMINCPYFANKIRNGKVILSGFVGGKGDYSEINRELNKAVSANQKIIIDKQDIVKLARRKRIGIDCSGFVFRLLSELIRLQYQNCPVKSLEEVFSEGIFRTNADKLTLGNHVIKVKLFSRSKLGDLIRINNGRHVAVVLEKKNNMITYIHSSKVTKESGVHTGTIMINNTNQTLEWREITRDNINFGDKYFHLHDGDGIFRLKIFNP